MQKSDICADILHAKRRSSLSSYVLSLSAPLKLLSLVELHVKSLMSACPAPPHVKGRTAGGRGYGVGAVRAVRLLAIELPTGSVRG